VISIIAVSPERSSSTPPRAPADRELDLDAADDSVGAPVASTLGSLLANPRPRVRDGAMLAGQIYLGPTLSRSDASRVAGPNRLIWRALPNLNDALVRSDRTAVT